MKCDFDYEEQYRKLVSDLADVLIKSIEKLPEKDKDIVPKPPKEKGLYTIE